MLSVEGQLRIIRRRGDAEEMRGKLRYTEKRICTVEYKGKERNTRRGDDAEERKDLKVNGLS